MSAYIHYTESDQNCNTIQCQNPDPVTGDSLEAEIESPEMINGEGFHFSYSINPLVFDKNKKEDGSDWGNFSNWTNPWETLQGTVEALQTIVKTGNGICPCILKDGIKDQQHFIQAQCVVIDIDNSEIKKDAFGIPVKDAQGYTIKVYKKELTIEEALEHPLVQEAGGLIYTSVNHTEDWNRFRIVFPLATEVEDPDLFRNLCKKVLADLGGGDPASANVGQGFYGNRNAVFPLVNPNAFLDSDYLFEAKLFEEASSLSPVSASKEKGGEFSEDQIREMLSFIPRRGKPGSGTHEDAIASLMAVHHHFEGDATGRKLIVERFGNSPDKAWNAGKKYDALKPGQKSGSMRTIATLVKLSDYHRGLLGVSPASKAVIKGITAEDDLSSKQMTAAVLVLMVRVGEFFKEDENRPLEEQESLLKGLLSHNWRITAKELEGFWSAVLTEAEELEAAESANAKGKTTAEQEAKLQAPPVVKAKQAKAEVVESKKQQESSTEEISQRLKQFYAQDDIDLVAEFELKLDLVKQNPRLAYQIDGLAQSIKKKALTDRKVAASGKQAALILGEMHRSLDLDEIVPPVLSYAIRELSGEGGLAVRSEVFLLGILPVLSSLFSSGTWITASKKSKFSVVPNLYSMMSAHTGQKKSPAMKMIADHPLAPLKEKYAEIYKKELKAWKRLKGDYENSLQSLKDDCGGKSLPPGWQDLVIQEFPELEVTDGELPPEPAPRIFHVEDYTEEALRAVHARQPYKGTFGSDDEMYGKFASENQYTGGKGKARQNFLKLYDGKRDSSLRASTASTEGTHEQIFGYFGAILLEKLAELLRKDPMDSEGTFARFLMVYQPETAGYINPDDLANDDTDQEPLLIDLLSSLYSFVDSLPPLEYRLDAAARREFAAAYNLFEDRKTTDSDPRMKAIWSKGEGRLLKIAGALHVIEMWDREQNKTGISPSASEFAQISRETVIKAMKIEAFSRSQAKFIYQMIDGEEGDSPVTEIMQKVMSVSKSQMRKDGEGWVTAGVVRRSLSDKQKKSWSVDLIRDTFRTIAEGEFPSGKGELSGVGSSQKFRWLETPSTLSREALSAEVVNAFRAELKAPNIAEKEGQQADSAKNRIHPGDTVVFKKDKLIPGGCIFGQTYEVNEADHSGVTLRNGLGNPVYVPFESVEVIAEVPF